MDASAVTSSPIDNRIWTATVTLKTGRQITTGNPQNVAFEVTYHPHTNLGEGTFMMYGFNRDTIFSIIEEGSRIEFIAGYECNAQKIFYGDIKNVHHIRQGTESGIRIFANSISRQSHAAKLVKTWGAGTSRYDIIMEAAREMNATLNLVPNSDDYWRQKLGKMGPSGYTYADYALKLLRDIAREQGANLYSYSAGGLQENDGAFAQFFMCEPGQASTVNRHYISAETGMEGSPEPIGGGIVVTTRLNSAIHPCDLIAVNSDYYRSGQFDPHYVEQRPLTGNPKGEYYAETIAHRGELEGQPWNTTIVGRNYNVA